MFNPPHPIKAELVRRIVGTLTERALWILAIALLASGLALLWAARWRR
jgi:hypothetical protein